MIHKYLIYKLSRRIHLVFFLNMYLAILPNRKIKYLNILNYIIVYLTISAKTYILLHFVFDV